MVRSTFHPSTPLAAQLWMAVAFVLLPCSLLRAASPDAGAMDAAAMVTLEHKAEQADVRERCFVYSTLLQSLAQRAGNEMQAGRDEEATATVQEMDRIAERIHETSSANAKRLKNAEQLMDRTTHHLADMARVASEEERSTMERTLHHLNRVHSDLLALVFAK